MNPEILTALIEAAGTIIASIIGVAGVFLIVKNRKDIIKLSKEVAKGVSGTIMGTKLNLKLEKGCQAPKTKGVSGTIMGTKLNLKLIHISL